MSPEIIALAKRVMKERKFSGFSQFVAQLIREDAERNKLNGASAETPVDGEDAKHKYIPPRERRVKRQ